MTRRRSMRPARAAAARCAAFLLAAALAACSEDLAPRSRLTDARLLAVVADPLEAGPGDVVTLRPFPWLPPGDAVESHEWRFCPFTLGAARAYECALPACEVPLAPAGDGSVSADPLALALACLAAGGGAPPPGLPEALPQRIDVAFRYRLATAAGTVREAIALVPFFVNGPPEPRNANPIVERVEIGGAVVEVGGTGPPLRPGEELELRAVLDPASAQPFTNELGEAAVESLVVSFFTTAGEFDGDRADGPDARQLLKGEELGDASRAEIWIVARDLRGGQAVRGPFFVPIER